MWFILLGHSSLTAGWVSGVLLIHWDRCGRKFSLYNWSHCPRIYSEELKNRRKILSMKLATIWKIQPHASIWAMFHELYLPVFASLDFATIPCFTGQGHQPCVQPPTCNTRTLYLCLPAVRLLSYTPTHMLPVSLSSTTRSATTEVL
jgi:hypothetical protein